MNATGLLIVGLAAAAGNAMNAAAGGGSFISFPALIFLGVPPIVANATNSMAMWVGGSGVIVGFRRDLIWRTRRFLAAVLVCTAAGTLGGLLVLKTPPAAYAASIKWLLLASTLLFVAAPAIRRLTQRAGAAAQDELPYSWLIGLVPIGIYGGFFGGGQGILLLALFAVAGMANLNRMNALKSTLTFVNNGTPLIPFVIAHVVAWNVAAAMCVGSLAGGFIGASLVRRLPPVWLRRTIIAIGAVVTVLFFLRG
jgi:uncharacterized membrane protein YfcA